MNVAMLKSKLSEKSITSEEVASYIGVDPSTYFRKMSAEGESFTIAQMKKLVELLGLSRAETVLIFLD